MQPGFYWIEILDQGPYIGPEVARLAADLFFTTRFDGCGESVTCANAPEYVRVLAGPLPEPQGPNPCPASS